jgi:hypothetical protein
MWCLMGRDADARVRGWHPRIARPGTALAVGILTVAMLASAAVTGSAAHQFQLSGLALIGLYLSFGLVGVVVAWHEPRNPMGSGWAEPSSSRSGCTTSTGSSAGPWPTRS